MEINLSIIQRVGAELNNNYVETLIMIWKLNHSFHFRTLPHIRWRPQPGDWDTNSERSFSTLWGNIVSIAVTSVLQFWHQCTWMFTKLWKVHTHAFSFYWKHIISYNHLLSKLKNLYCSEKWTKISPPDIMTLVRKGHVFWS